MGVSLPNIHSVIVLARTVHFMHNDAYAITWSVLCYQFDLNVTHAFNPFLNAPFWDRPKFKEAADNN